MWAVDCPHGLALAVGSNAAVIATASELSRWTIRNRSPTVDAAVARRPCRGAWPSIATVGAWSRWTTARSWALGSSHGAENDALAPAPPDLSP